MQNNLTRPSIKHKIWGAHPQTAELNFESPPPPFISNPPCLAIFFEFSTPTRLFPPPRLFASAEYADMFRDRILLAITAEPLTLVLGKESNIQVPKYFVVNVK